MALIVESLNVGMPKEEKFPDKNISTGICKEPVDGPRFLTKTGFKGDGVGDTKHHGGPDKAVCVYSAEHYSYWEEELGGELPRAAFGENITVSGLYEKDICIGDVFRLGSALVQVSQPRQPCKTLAARYGRNDFVKLVVDSGFTGFYFKVIKEGEVKKGDKLQLHESDPGKVTVAFANHVFHKDKKNRESLRKVLAVPALSRSWQKSLNELLDKC